MKKIKSIFFILSIFLIAIIVSFIYLQTKKITKPVTLKNQTFYYQSKDYYSDNKFFRKTGIVSTCAIKIMDGKTINASYKGTKGKVEITKGSSPGCPPDVIVESGIFIPDNYQPNSKN